MGPAAEEAEAGSVGATAAAGQLNAAAAVGATLTKDVHQMEWNGQISENMFHLFVNSTAEPLELSWGDELRDNPHSTVGPHDTAYLGTYSFHTWRIRSKSRGHIATYTGPSVILTITETSYTTELNPSGRRPHQLHTTGPAATAAANGTTAAASQTAAGGSEMTSASARGGQSSEPGYRQRASVLEMPIWAFDCVSDAAVARVAHVVSAMLAHSPAPLLERLVEGGASFAVFGTDQVVTDVPAHRFMRYNTGRDLDTSARGLGATPAVPVTSCGEENLTMQGDRWYPCQSILIHEMGHMVHNMGLPSGPEGVEGVLEAYRAAMKARLYPKGCYMMTNEQEYWAVAVESWFESTIRGDVNGGIKTRAQLRKHDPRLAALLEAAFGDGEWRYWKDCPRQLSMPTRAAAAATATATATVTAAMQPQRRPSNMVAPSPPSWRSRRPAKLVVDSMLDNAESSPAGGGALGAEKGRGLRHGERRVGFRPILLGKDTHKKPCKLFSTNRS
ncbi:hypothetical protein Vretimale_16970 [Volvox reticuliferus]|uniref:von Hippel-Lindau disease tumour suppressor beta domain-containing protein n=1 Tax=Volvox reticuliferus TaxID=1737510 RepID=A0A8J4LXA8_9CHLO|nr:hypothetical protein Vretifemale_16740 [Volvox reticuliferus]GIM13911.1 hypothetical protein Vretimale_16970 [Volvox reticuliferus]